MLPELVEIAKFLPELPDLDKIGENVTFLKSILFTGEYSLVRLRNSRFGGCVRHSSY